MSDVIIFDRMQQRRGTLANLESVNEVLLEGEFCVILDTGEMKIGDGTTAWNSLPYFNTDKVPEGTRLYFTNQRVYDAVKAMLVEGSNVTITADDEELTITISATGGGGGGFPEGDSFPGSPATGQKFYRTDLNMLCYYDGTRWLTVQEYTVHTWYDDIRGNNSNAGSIFIPILQKDIYVTSWGGSVRVTGNNNNSQYWIFKLQYRDYVADTVSDVGDSYSTQGLDFSITPWVLIPPIQVNQAVEALQLRINLSKVGAAGTTYRTFVVNYRLIIE